VVSFPPVYSARSYTPPSPRPYAPHAQPISFRSILILVLSTHIRLGLPSGLIKVLQLLKLMLPVSHAEPGSSVGIATELRAGRSGDRIPVAVRYSAPVQTGLGVHPPSCTMGAGSFPGVKRGRGVTLTPHPF